ncbi:MAG: polysaccharide biosynthesis tyrosine autokinase [Tabrizicola sp.]|nr:polysaccharide biosynthesis tyrosine autokinase [Tabrizicola sp.]
MILSTADRSAGPIATSTDAEIDLVAVVRAIWAARALLVVSTLGALVIGALYAKTRPPTWRADGLIQIESNSSRLVVPEALSQLAVDSAPSSLTEIEILRSRSVLSDAAAAVHLDWDVSPKFAPIIGQALYYGKFLNYLGGSFDPYPRPGEGLSIEYLQVPSEWINQTIEVTIQTGGEYEILLPDQAVLKGQEGELLTDNVRGLALELGQIEAPPGRQFEIRQIPEHASVARLAGSLSVAELGRQTGILKVSVTAADPVAATRWLDAVLSAYQNKSITNNAAEASQSLSFVEEQIPIAKAQVTDAERALNDYRTKQQSIDIPFETGRLLDESAQLETQIREALVQERDLSQRFTPNHPIFRQAVARRESLERRLVEVRASIDELPETQREVVNLTRTLEVAQAAYLQLLNRAQELRVLQASEIGNVRVIDSAQAGQRPVAPRTSRILGLALLVGLFAGIGVALLRNFLRKGVDSAQEIEAIGIPVLGVSVLAAKVSGDAKNSVPLVVRDETEGATAEAFRSIRTALRFMQPGAKSAALVLTSPFPGAGKSFCSANLGVIAANGGQRVCIVDADLRRGVLARSFNLSPKLPGLSDYLIGQATLDDVIASTMVDRLDVVTTGRRPPNPSELLMSESFDTFFRDMAGRYDLVIFDTPPTLLVTDAALISRMAAVTIVVARHAETELQDIIAVRRALELGGGKIDGAILNAFDPKRAKPSSYQYGSYGYGYKYRYSRHD